MQAGNVQDVYLQLMNQHGYAFHYAVIRRAEKLFNEKKSKWVFEVAEFPVSLKNIDTRIDFVLRNPWANIYLIAECKRANPAISNWCFAKAPYTRHGVNVNNMIVEGLQFDRGLPVSIRKKIYGYRDQYQIGLEVKSSEKGDSFGKGRGAIERSLTQVLRGLNGFILEAGGNNEVFEGKEKKIWFIPVIFTTAKLFVTDTNINTADIKDGKLNIDDLNVESRDWLWYQYNLSPGLKHSIAYEEEVDNLSNLMARDYIRTVALVAPSGVDDFLGSSLSFS